MTEDLEAALFVQIVEAALPVPERQARLVPGRRFRSDFCWREERVVLEVHGGEWSGGRHTSGVGLTSDCEKTNLLTLAGWRCYAVTGSMVRDGRALALLQRVFGLDERGEG
jgi:very-short-patch-repair endonuclease